MATKKINAAQDRPQRVCMSLVEATTNGGKITQVPTSFSTKDKIGIEILRAEYFVRDQDGASLTGGLVADGSKVSFGLCQLYKSNVPPLSPLEPGVVDFNVISHVNLETGTMANLRRQSEIVWPLERDYPGGILVHPASIYAWIRGTDAAQEMEVDIWLTFRYVDLSNEDYLDILQNVILQNQL